MQQSNAATRALQPAAHEARGAKRGRGGRPTLQDAERIRARILDVATEMLFTNGYGATSIEAIAKQAGVSKRTFYHRFEDKPALMSAAVARVIDELRPRSQPLFASGLPLPELLFELALIIVRAALSPRLLQLRRLMLAEAARFPELAAAVARASGRQEAVSLISALLSTHGTIAVRAADAEFAAEQFLQMVVSVPQARAMGLGTPMDEQELHLWLRRTIAFFLSGYHGLATPAANNQGHARPRVKP